MNPDAELNQEISVTTDVMVLIDAWGHQGVPFINGSGIVTIDNSLGTEIQPLIPIEFSINQIYPNPFNPVTTIYYSVETLNKTSLQVFDLTGRLIETLIHKNLEPGNHQIDWHPRNIPSGLYFVELKSGNKREIQKITLLK